MLLLLVAASLLFGCDRVDSLFDETPESAAPPVDSVDFVVDGDGVFYATLVGPKRLLPTDRLSKIALADRAAVVVHVRGKTPELEGRHYVARMIEAKPGDTRTARLLPEAAILERLESAEQGARAGLRVVWKAEAMLDVPKKIDSDAAFVRAEAGEPPAPTGDHGMALDLEEPEAIDLFDEAEGDVDDNGGERGEVQTQTSGGDTIRIRRLNAADGRPVRTGRAQPRSRRSGRAPRDHASWKHVTLYYAQWCGVCKSAKRWLDAHRVPYEAVDIEASKSNRRQMQRFCRQKNASTNSIPTFRIGDDIMQGWSAERFEQLAMR